MQLKGTCFYVTVLLSLFIVNPASASPVDAAERNLVERSEGTDLSARQYDS